MSAGNTKERRAVGRGGLLASAIALAMVVGAIEVYATASPHGTATGHRYVIRMEDYAFQPAHMVWHVGEKITLTLVNASVSHPPKSHEWMMGQIANREHDEFGLDYVSDGFETAFFKGVTIKLVSGKLLDSIVPGQAKLIGADRFNMMIDHGKYMEDNGEHFVPVVAAGGSVTFTFTVPNKVGRWEYGCFQQTGAHYRNGMHGLVEVKPAVKLPGANSQTKLNS